MQAKLYGVAGSHPTKAAELMLRQKGLPHTRLDLPPLLHKPLVRLLGFPEWTVPALQIDGRKVQRTRRIAAVLDQLHPEPRLCPEEPRQRAAVDEAEKWGFLAGARLAVPRPLMKLAAPVIVPLNRRRIGSRDAAIRDDMRALPALLDRIDAWIADGLVAREPPNVADFQIGTSLRLLMCMDDLRPTLEHRPADQPMLTGPCVAAGPLRRRPTTDPRTPIARRASG